MNHSEKTRYHQSSDEYLRNNQVRELIQKAVCELAAKQPEQPLDFLINFFQQRKKFRVFAVVGFDASARKHVIEEVAAQFNLKVLRTNTVNNEDLADSADYAHFIRSFDKFESNFDGVLLDDFPSSLHQLACLKREKVLLDRVFALLPAQMLEGPLSPEQRLRVAQVSEVAREMSHVTTVCENADLQKIAQRVCDNVFIKLRQLLRTAAPRLLFFHHPARPEVGLWLRLVARYYDLHVIDAHQLLADQRDQLKRQGALSHEALTRRVALPDDVLSADQLITAFVQHALADTSCTTKGFVLVNYPLTPAQREQFIKMRFEPQLIIRADEPLAASEGYLTDLKIDRDSGRLFSPASALIDDKAAESQAFGHSLQALNADQQTTLRAGKVFWVDIRSYETAAAHFPETWKAVSVNVQGNDVISTEGKALTDQLVSFFKYRYQ